MKATTIISSLLLSLSLLAGPAIAESEQRQSQVSIEQGLAEIQKRLKLSEQQKSQLEPIFQARGELRKQVMEKYGVTGREGFKNLSFKHKRALAKEIKAINASSAEKVQAILSQEQYAEYQKIQQENRDKMRGKRKHR